VFTELQNGLGQGIWHIEGRREIHTEFWWRKLTERDHLEDTGIDKRIIIRRTINKQDVQSGLD
jgi:hypothetical protein